jgi:uncharacterized protein (TIGR03083 family)
MAGHRKEGNTMATQAELVTVIQTESDRLRQYLAALPADAWTKPSACALWEVRDVVAHLIPVIHGYTLRITRALQGKTSPPEGVTAPINFKTLSPEERRQFALRLAQRPITERERLGNDLPSVFGQAWDQFRHLLLTLNAHDWDKPCYHGLGIIPVHSLAHTGVFELAIHSWDIRSALEPSAPFAPDTLAAILDFFAECPHWFFLPDTRLSTPLRYRFVFPDARNGPWDIVIEGETASIGPSPEAPPAHATFACERETFALMMCGRIGFDAAMGDKRIIPTGDIAVAQEFKKWFQGV